MAPSMISQVGRSGSSTGFRWQAAAATLGPPVLALALGEFAARLLAAQDAGAAGMVVRGLAAAAAIGLILRAIFLLATPSAWTATGIELAALLGGGGIAEAAARGLSPVLGTVVQLAATLAGIWWMHRVFKAAPHHRFAATAFAAALGLAGCVWFAWRREWYGTTFGLGGITAMGIGFLLGLAAIRGLLTASTGITAVARTTLDEALRMRVGLVLVVLLLVTLPLLPLLLDPTERLEYRLQFLLSWALGGTGFILGLLTVLLACGSICGDIDTNRIHMTLTKPITRAEFLVGKWLGLVLLNLLLVSLAGAGVYTFTRMLAKAPADEADREAVASQVLTARTNVLPEHPRGADFERDMAREIERIRNDNPDFLGKGDAGRQMGRIRYEMIWQWHTVTADKQGEYVFRGLGPAKAAGDTFQLQLKPHADNASMDRADVSFALWLNDRPYPVSGEGQHLAYTLASRTLHTITLPTREIDDEGVLRMRIANRNAIPPGEKVPTSINFSPGKGLQVLYAVGSFENNYVRNLVEMWLKLVTIAAIGVAAATGLGFPVAALLGLMMFVAAIGSGYLGSAVDIYTGLDLDDATLSDMVALRSAVFGDFIKLGDYWGAVKVIMALFGEAFLAVIPSFANFDSVTSLATGMQITRGNVVECLLRLGLVAPLALGLIGWFVFERRDLVRSNS